MTDFTPHPLIMEPNLKVLSFDAGFTLIEPHPPVGEVYAHVAARYDYAINPDLLSTRFFEAFSRGLERVRSGESISFNTSEAGAREWWHQIAIETFSDSIPVAGMAELSRALFEEYASGKCYKTCDGVPDVLVKIRSVRPDLRLVVLSNWDARLVSVFRDMRLDRYFDRLFYSSEIGHEKPHPEAFQAVLDACGIQAEQLLHIGDSLEDDAHGATAMGAKALLVQRSRQSLLHTATPANEDCPCAILPSLEALL